MLTPRVIIPARDAVLVVTTTTQTKSFLADLAHQMKANLLAFPASVVKQRRASSYVTLDVRSHVLWTPIDLWNFVIRCGLAVVYYMMMFDYHHAPYFFG